MRPAPPAGALTLLRRPDFRRLYAQGPRLGHLVCDRGGLVQLGTRGETRLPGDGELETAVAGVVNRNTKVRTTPDSIFEIGSITKVYTACLVMQLVDDGLVDVDDPIVKHVPGLRLADDANFGRELDMVKIGHGPLHVQDQRWFERREKHK